MVNLYYIVDNAMNINCILNVNIEDSKIREKFSNELKLTPLCDDKGNLVDVADVLKSHKFNYGTDFKWE